MPSLSPLSSLVLVIYPTSGKPIDQTNDAFLLDLAKEYVMMKLTEKYENYLILNLEKEASEFQMQFRFAPKQNFKCLKLLNIEQNYGLDRLQSACIEAMRFKFQELTTDTNYKNISVSNRERILEGIVRRTEEELKIKEQVIYSKDNQTCAAKEKAKAAIQELEKIIYIVVVAYTANCLPSSVSDNLLCIRLSNGDLRKLADPLNNLQDKLMDLSMLLE